MMKLIKNRRWRMLAGIVISLLLVFVSTGAAFISQSSFGHLPRGERLERIKRSSHYKNGIFENIHPTPLMTSDKGRFEGIWEFLFSNKDGLYQKEQIPVIKTDLTYIFHIRELAGVKGVISQQVDLGVKADRLLYVHH